MLRISMFVGFYHLCCCFVDVFCFVLLLINIVVLFTWLIVLFWFPLLFVSGAVLFTWLVGLFASMITLFMCFFCLLICFGFSRVILFLDMSYCFISLACFVCFVCMVGLFLFVSYVILLACFLFVSFVSFAFAYLLLLFICIPNTLLH